VLLAGLVAKPIGIEAMPLQPAIDLPALLAVRELAQQASEVLPAGQASESAEIRAWLSEVDAGEG
jgi:hypothetical protein